jgi:uncharacterized membrane protein YdbT with pleckstrin-like domain
MAFPRRLLTEGETIVLDLRPHWKALVGPVLWTILIGAAVGLGYVKMVRGDARDPLRIALVVLAFIAWFKLAGLPMARWRFTQFVLTNERVISRSGVIAKHSREIPVETINDVTFNQSILERILNAGDLVIESAGEHGQDRFTDIRRPEQVQLEVYRISEARRGLARGAPGPSLADELAKLADLRDRGALTPEEFEARKRRLLEG